ncbi:tyrosine-type recombinase/integrase [Clostridium sp. PL3]|uniref:Tyrosine-type recombinase/integrase n=1 Tax=Clostridium thailandense TaxID=2794346 RepID=A0A949WRT9_9CLOT|nr:site-specific integrase [Clostridium thailandense]MBV7274415.1 tyrosine-type recombinase/integrase [Clostridium thailandense]
MKQTDFAKALTRYLSEFLPGQRNVSTNTIKSYRDTFKQLLLYMDNKCKIKPEYLTFNRINSETIRNFLFWLENTRSVNINTRNQRLAAIHSFYRYVQSECPDILFECQKILGIPFKRRQQATIEHITQENLQLLLEQPNITTKRGRRDLVLMVTLYDSGARIQELIDLKVCDVRLSKPATVTLTGKGNKRRTIPIMNKTKLLLEKYMNEQHLLENGKQNHPVFFNSRNHSFTRPGVTYILEKHFASAKKCNAGVVFPKHIHPHMLRHTKAFHLLDAGVNLIYIRDFLGHVNVTTTEVYLRADTEMKRKALESMYIDVVSQDIPVWNEDTDLLSWLQDFCK